MNKLILCFVVLFFIGCEQHEMPSWDRAPLEYKCTDSEIDRVHKEAKFCDDQTGYYSTYCYGSAIMRNCTKIEEAQKIKNGGGR